LISSEAPTAESAARTAAADVPEGGSASEALPPSSASAEEMMDYLVSQIRHFKGDSDAPVTIIEFSDYKCPYCGKFAADSEPLINQNYIEEGLVRFGYWHVAFLGPESQWAAEAAECAAEQDAFWDYHELLFIKGNSQVAGGFSRDNLKSFARELDLNGDEFDECVDSGRHTETIQTDTALAQQIGAGSTPAFLINGQPVVGAQPYEVFQQVIEQQLASQN
jgi:protein-disulfide isomerase